MKDMAQRLAEAGYLVLLPDLFYRHGAYGPLVPAEVFAGDTMAILGPLIASTGTEKIREDTGAFLKFLDARQDVKGTSVCAVGFCMGGGLTLAAASAFPGRFAAVASFHGGNLATGAADSPHRLAGSITAEVHIAAAENDDSYPPDMADRLEAALKKHGVRYTAATYAGAAHGWMVPDFPTYQEGAAHQGWQALQNLFARNLDK